MSAAEREPALELFSGSGDGIDRSRIPSVKPTFDRIHVDDHDHLWVIPQVVGEQPGRFGDIFGPWVAFVLVIRALPGSFVVLASGDQPLLLSWADYDLPKVEPARWLAGPLPAARLGADLLNIAV